MNRVVLNTPWLCAIVEEPCSIRDPVPSVDVAKSRGKLEPMVSTVLVRRFRRISPNITHREMQPESGASFDLYDELSLPALRKLYRRRRRLILGTSALVTAATVGVLLLRPPVYRSSCTFAPRTGKSSAAAAAGLAAQFGLSIPGGDPTDSPQFYADLIRRRTILDTVLTKVIATDERDGGGGKTLAQMLAPDVSGALRTVDARKKLLTLIATDVDPKTNVVTVVVSTTAPRLSQVVATEILRAVNEFTLEGRQSRAHQERQFTQARAEEARLQLSESEAQLESFLESNRATGAPRLEFALDRLRRQVASRQALYTALAQAADQSRIEELRDTPSLTVIDQPDLPSKPESRGVIVFTIMSLIFGALLGLFLAFAAEMIGRDQSRVAA